MDGTQARLKRILSRTSRTCCSCGKGGWDSGEIETIAARNELVALGLGGKGGWDSGEIETL